MSGELSVGPEGREDEGLPRVSVGVLGPVVLVGDGDGGLGGPQQRLVLSVLACEAGRVVSSDRLVTAVWGQDAGDGNRRTLQVYVSKLRSALEDVASIEHRDGGYVLEVPDDALDLWRFERLIDEGAAARPDDPERSAELLRAALDLWRGRPFGDLGSAPALSAEVERLEQLQLRAWEELADIEIDRGQQDRMIPELRRLASEHPLRERLWRLLMLALYRSGRQGESLEAYEAARRTLAEDLGVDPSRDLQELHTAILRHDASLDPPDVPTSEVAAEEAGGVVSGATEVSANELVGRDRELARLSELVQGALSGRPHLVLLGGDAGVGKSRLLHEAGRAASAEGFDVLIGRCIDLGDAALPFAPVAQILRRLARRFAEDGLDEALGPARHELARMVPELGDARPDGGSSDPEVRGRLFSAALDALDRLAGLQPLLVAFEDVHWADRSTLDLLGFLARNLDGERVLLTATFRTDELHRRHPLRAVLGELTRLVNVVRIDLEPLDAEHVAAQIRGILGRDPEPGLLRDVATRSSGNPFYVEELVAAAREGDPGLGAGLRDVVASRLERLPEESRQLLDVAAVAGGSVDQRLLAAATGEDPLVLARGLRPAVERHVLVAEDTGYRFRHDLVREVVTDDLLPGERVALHARIARALAEQPELASGGADHADAEVAHHWYAAREDQRAFTASIRAADRARRTGALAEALTHDERVLELWERVEPDASHDRVEILERAAETARLTGSYRRGIALMREALEEVDDDPLREADLRRVLGLALALDAHGSEAARAEAERALALVADQPPSERKARIVHAAARIHVVDDHFAAGIELGREAIAIAEEVGDRLTEVNAHITVGTALAGSGRDVDAGLAQLRGGLDVAKELGDIETIGRGYNNLVLCLRSTLELDPTVVEDLLHEALSWLDDQGEQGAAHALMRNNIAMTSLFQGDWELARQALDDVSVMELEGSDRAYFLVVRSLLRHGRGMLDEARDDARTVHELGVDYSGYRDWAYTVEAFVAVEQGGVDEVRRILDERRQLPADAGELEGQDTFTVLRLLRLLVRGEIENALCADDPALRTEHLRRADQALAEIRQLHEELHDDHVTIIPATRHLAETNLRLAVAERSRVRGPAPDRWRAVLDHAVPGYDRIYAGWRLGEAMLAAGDDRGADELREAHREATRQGAGLLRERIVITAEHHRVRLEQGPAVH